MPDKNFWLFLLQILKHEFLSLNPVFQSITYVIINHLFMILVLLIKNNLSDHDIFSVSKVDQKISYVVYNPEKNGLDFLYSLLYTMYSLLYNMRQIETRKQSTRVPLSP